VEAFWYSDPASDASCEALPDASVDVCFALSESKPEIVVFGPVTTRTVCELRPNVPYIGIRFRPGMAALVLPENAAGLTDCAIPVPSFMGVSADRIMDLEDFAARRRYLETAIEQLLARRSHDAATLVSNAIELIHRAHCNIRIQQLADECGVSRRHLERVFSEYVGVSPKFYARIYRFRAVMNDVATSAPLSWADIAVSHGYADQSHFIREYRSFSGHIPTGQ
jgi:AraC-like DNA-binding protein